MTGIRSKRIRVALVTLASLVAVLGVLYILEKTRVTNFIKDPSYTQPTEQGPTEADKQLSSDVEAKQKAESIESTKNGDQATSAEVPSNSDTITVSATQSGDSVTIHNELRGQGYSSGTCKLSVTNGSKSISQNADIIYQSEYSMCAGFSIPTSQVGVGTWNIVLEVTPFNGTTLTKSITYRVN